MSANMKVIKRDGSVVEYDRNKIVTAIQKANAEVSEEERLSQDRIEPLSAALRTWAGTSCLWRRSRTWWSRAW